MVLAPPAIINQFGVACQVSELVLKVQVRNDADYVRQGAGETCMRDVCSPGVCMRYGRTKKQERLYCDRSLKSSIDADRRLSVLISMSG